MPTQSTPARFFTVATAGHVDHGKTSLLKTLTGIDTDRLKEEKERQMTTDLGFAHLRLPDNIVIGFIDVPGHGKFLKNMLAGVGGIDMALLVVAADEGPMPQTEQHIRILALLGVHHVLVALSKTDVCTADRISSARERTTALLKSYGVAPFAFVEISSISGSGFDQLKKELHKFVSNVPAPSTTDGGAFLPIDRSFTKSGFGTVITGTLVRGTLRTGQEIVVQPGSINGRIRRLEAFGEPIEIAQPGQRLACNLALRDNARLARGQVIVDKQLPTSSNLLLSMEFWPNDPIATEFAQLEGQDVRIYHGTAEIHGRLTWLEALPEAARSLLANVVLDHPVVANVGDRYIIRLSDDTIYGGAILLKDRPRWMTRKISSAIATELVENDYASAIGLFLSNSPQTVVSQALLSLFIPPALIHESARQASLKGVATTIGAAITTPERKSKFADQIISVLSKSQQAENARPTAESIRLQFGRTLDRETFQALIAELIDQARVERHGDKLSLAGAKTTTSADTDTAAQEKLLSVLSAHLCLEIEELAQQCNLSTQRTRALLDSLSRSGRASIVNYEFASPSAALSQAHRVLSELWSQKEEISPGEFRARLNTTRKYAMALLAHFDDQQITRRLPAGRVLLRAFEK